MKPKFKHFVIVKFDYPENYKFLDTKKQQLRWALCDSLRKQTNTEFVMVFNSTMPMPHEGFGELIISPCWKDKVRESAKDYEYVITTRLDGDDFVTHDFIEKIQDAFEEKDKLVLVPKGWIYDCKTKRLTNNWMTTSYTTNAISFIEKSDNMQSCYVREHGKMGKFFDVKRLEDKIHIWCINEESLRAGLQRDGKFTDHLPDISKELFEKYPPAEEIINRINIWNKRINDMKEKDDNK